MVGEIHINYSFADSQFSALIISFTAKRISNIAFDISEPAAFENLQKKFPNAAFKRH